MTDRTVRTRYEAQIGQWEAAMATMAASTRGLAKEIDGLAGRSKGSFKSMGMDLLGVGAGEMAAAAGAAVAGAAVLKFTADGVKSYVNLADEVRSYQRATGESAEEASKMVAVANVLGVSVDTVSNGMFRLSRNILAHADALEADGVVIAKTNDGQIDLAGTLGNVADAYHKTGAGAAGNLIVFDAFGRSGLSMIPILQQDKAALQGFYDEAARHHEILSQADVDKAFQFKVEVRELGQAWTGLERELGQKVVPQLTTTAKWPTTVIDKADSAGPAIVRGFSGSVAPITAVTGRLHDLVFGHDKAADAAHRQAVQEQHTADTLAAEARAVSEFTKSLDEMYAKTFGVEGAQAKFNKDLFDFTDKVKAARINGDAFAASLDASTSTGLANQDMVRGLAQDIVNTAKVAAEGGGDVVAATEAQRQELAQVLEQLGFNEAETQRYTQALAGIPAQVATTISLNIDTSGIGGWTKILTDPKMTDTVNQALKAPTGPLQLPQGVLDALAGRGSASQAALKAQEAAGKKGADDAKRAQEELASYLESVWKQQGEVLKNTFEMTGNGLDAYVAHLDAELAHEKPYTDAWVQLQQEKEAALTHQADVLKNVAGIQHAIEDNMHTAGITSNRAYLDLLEQRLAGTQRFSNDWMAIWNQIHQVEQQIAQDDQTYVDAAKSALDRLNQLLDQEQSLHAQLVKLADDHRKALAAIEGQYNTDMAKILDDRRQQLQGWADVTQRVTIQWGNTAATLTDNVRSQIDVFDQWVQALDGARQHGVSDQVVSLLGLDQGPQALGQLRMFASATDQQIADLNAAVASRQKQIDERVTAEATASSSKIAAQLRTLAQQHAAAVEAENEQFLAQQRDLNTQLAAVGLDGGRSFGDALTAGLLSSLPGVQQAAQKLRDAMQQATGHQSYSTDANALVSLPGGGQVSVAFLASQGVPGYSLNADGSYHVPTDATMVTMAGNVPVSQYGFATSNLPHYAGGVDFVPNDGAAFIHRGERVFSVPENARLTAAIERMSMGGGAGGDVVLHNHFHVDGREVAHVAERVTADRLRGLAMQRATVGSR